jgi:hypothetical protein
MSYAIVGAMTFFADLTPHSYSPTGGLEILNIGWLDEGQTFPVGPTSQPFQDALLELCEHPIILHRGVHKCWFCRGKLQDMVGNGQIRVLTGSGIWYAAPTLVHHYVTRHGYSPPADFVDAVLSPIAVAIDHGWRYPHPNTAS